MTMTLAHYLSERGITLKEFGGEIQRSKSTVSRLVRGLNKPDWDTMKEIERATGGLVTPNDFRQSKPPRSAGKRMGA